MPAGPLVGCSGCSAATIDEMSRLLADQRNSRESISHGHLRSDAPRLFIGIAIVIATVNDRDLDERDSSSVGDGFE
jgi:hypothetical protein